MTLIANPIYDVVFKFLMEDERVAKMLLSALLKKEIVTLQMRQHEYTSVMQNRISLFRMNFSAKIKEPDGDEHMVLIELQKTWLATETLRFRQYLGTQYLSKTSMCEDAPRFGLSIISIYILGHLLGDLQEPVIYVRRRYLDYDDRVIEQKDPFIESLMRDSIIVQIPCLKGRTRTRLERLLNVFDQDYQMDENAHLLEINEDIFVGEEQLIVTRLLKAGVAPDVRRAMEVEDEILSEIEARDTLIMQKEQEIEKKSQEIEEQSQEIEKQSQEIEQKARELRQREEQVKNITRMLKASGMSEEKILEMLASPSDNKEI